LVFKFLHAADIHLDSPFLALSKYPGAPVEKIKLATREALANLVTLAIDESVAFVVIAGDVYDGDWDDYNTGHYFNSQMAKLAGAGIGVYLISGNHDAQNKMTKALRLPENVHSFPTDAPATVRLENVPVSLHGQGFATQSVKHDLSLAYPLGDADRFNIGLLHTSVDGREGHDDYAPCTVSGLCTKGYDYWALGHIHKREIVRDRNPMIVFPGNIQGRHIRESGAKGCLLVEVDDNNRIARHAFHALDTFRWEISNVDLSESEDMHDALALVGEKLAEVVANSDGRPSAVRVVLSGACPWHDELFARQSRWMEEIRSVANSQGSENLWVEKVKFKTTQKSLRDLAELDGPIAELSTCLKDWAASEAKLLELREMFTEIKRKVPGALLQGEEGLPLDDVAWLKATLEDVEKLAIGRLLSQEETR
jgi:DNA repair exonuclease SbcCD nuclease subunit